MRTLVLATLSALGLLACGGEGGDHAHDAAPAFDAVVPDAAVPGPVALAITNGGTGVAGATVYFQNADSSVVTITTTDSTGTATAMMIAGGFVTAIVPTAAPALASAAGFQPVELHTFAGVRPGDQLVLDTPAGGTARPVRISAPLTAGATVYELYTTCGLSGIAMAVGGTSATVSASLPDNCPTADFAVWASAGSGTPPAIAYAPAVTVGAVVDLTASTYAPASSVALTFTDVPAGVGAVFGDQDLVTAAGVLPSAGALDAVVSGGRASATLPQPAIASATLLTAVEPDFGGAARGDQTIFTHGPLAASFTLDVGATVLHEYSATPTFTVATHAMTWTETAVGVAPDAHVAELAITRGVNTWTWSLAAPRGSAPSLSFPVLPAGLFDYNAAATDTVEVGRLDAAKLPGGYDAIRAHAFATTAPLALASGSGTVVLEQLVVVTPAVKRRHHP